MKYKGMAMKNGLGNHRRWKNWVLLLDRGFAWPITCWHRGARCAGKTFRVQGHQGQVWFLGGYPSQLYADYMAGTVRVEGEIRSTGVILPSKVEYKGGNTWKRIL